LRERGVKVHDLDSPACREMLSSFIAAHPQLWHEDIGES
jgi:cytosine/creatinine deaminase